MLMMVEWQLTAKKNRYCYLVPGTPLFTGVCEPSSVRKNARASKASRKLA